MIRLNLLACSGMLKIAYTEGVDDAALFLKAAKSIHHAAQAQHLSL